jgi:gluconokinase
MLDKIRLHAAGRLPPAYLENLGAPANNPGVFDGRTCRFLRLAYEEIRDHTLAHPRSSDAEILAWCETRAAAAGHTARTDEECEIFNAFLCKRGWRDPGAGALAKRLAETPHVAGRPIMTMFDYIDFDEGRDPVAGRFWETPPGA